MLSAIFYLHFVLINLHDSQEDISLVNLAIWFMHGGATAHYFHIIVD